MPDVKIEKPRAGRLRVDQWTSNIRPTWSTAQVKTALYEHQTGNFSQSALLVEAMLADDELPTSLEAAVNAIAGAEFSLVPALDGKGKPEPNSQTQIDALEPHWSTSFPEHEIASLIRWFIMLGVAVGTIDWDTKQTPWKPTLRTLHPEFLWWDEGTRDPQTGLMGVFRYNHRDGSNEIVTPGDGRWVLLSDGRASWMRCSVRALATTWLVKQYTWRDWARYNERHGLPIVKAKVPVMADSSDKADFFANVRAIGTDTTALLPQFNSDDGPNYDLELLEAKDQSWATFEKTIARCDRKIQVHFNGSNTNELIGTAGSRATSESGRNIAGETAAERERRISTDLRDQLVKPFSFLNVPGADLSLAPWPHYATEGEEDMGKRNETVKAFFEGVNGAKAAGYSIANIVELAKGLGLELEEREEEEPEDDGSALGGNGGDDDMGDDGKPERGGESESEELAALDDSPAPQVDEVGKRDGAVSAQRYLDSLTDQLTGEALAIERVDAETMAAIVEGAKSPEDMIKRLGEHVNGADPVELAVIYEKAILLAQLAGRFGAQEDL